MATHWSDWLFWNAGWALAGVAAVLLLWALIGNRSRGRRRCRKCWYDMGSINAVDGHWTCPECGVHSVREEQLHKPRRRWRLVGACSFVFMLAYAIWATPRIRDEGWTGAVPTTAAILGMDLLGPSVPEQDAFLNSRSILEGKDPRAVCYKAVRDRVLEGELAEWQIDLLLWQARRAARGSSNATWALSESLTSQLPWQELIDSNDNWLHKKESLIHVRILTPSAPGQKILARVRAEYVEPSRFSYSVRLTPLTPGMNGVWSFTLGPYQLGCFQRLPVVYGLTTVDLGTPENVSERPRYAVSVARFDPELPEEKWTIVHQSELDLPMTADKGQLDLPEPLSADLQPTAQPVLELWQNRDESFLRLNLELPFDIECAAFAGVGEVVCNDTVLHKFEFRRESYHEDFGDHWLVLSIEPSISLQTCDADLTLRLTGDRLIAMRDLDATHYWDGVIEVPIE